MGKRRQSGSMLIFGAGILLFLASFAVFAVDIGRIFVVRTEMQNVADAAALAGANCLMRQSQAGTTADCVAAMVTSEINWDRAEARARAHLSENNAAQMPISSTDAGHEIEVGYWNLLTRSASGGTFDRDFSPVTVNDKPAVRVRVRKDADMNNGPIAMLTRMIFFANGQDVPMTAEAVAVISNPGSVFPNSLIPQVINECMFDLFWDRTTNSPRLYEGDNTNLHPATIPLQRMNEPYVVRIGSSYHYGTCHSGQWTTFDQDSNAQAVVNRLINEGNPNSMDIGDPTWIKPGTGASGYNEMAEAFSPLPTDVTVAVVSGDTDLSHLTREEREAGRQLPIEAFAGFRIQRIQGGGPPNDQFHIQGQFIPANITPGSGVGPSFGAYTPPRIAN